MWVTCGYLLPGWRDHCLRGGMPMENDMDATISREAPASGRHGASPPPLPFDSGRRRTGFRLGSVSTRRSVPDLARRLVTSLRGAQPHVSAPTARVPTPDAPPATPVAAARLARGRAPRLLVSAAKVPLRDTGLAARADEQEDQERAHERDDQCSALVDVESDHPEVEDDEEQQAPTGRTGRLDRCSACGGA